MISIVARVHDFPYNFRQLILGKSFLNIADSFYAIAVSVGLVAVYHITILLRVRCQLLRWLRCCRLCLDSSSGMRLTGLSIRKTGWLHVKVFMWF